MTHTIVVADNERGIRQFCKQELEAEGYRVLLAHDGEEAVEIIGSVSVDLAILDQHMPRCHGLQAAKHVKQCNSDLPVILFTADSMYDQFKSPWIDAAVVKSEDLSELKTTVFELLAHASPDSLVTATAPLCS
jgi:CheY-like chemotaxis protein